MTRSRAAATAMLKRFEEAFEGYSWRGGGNPADVPYWEERYAKARERMIKALMGSATPAIRNPEPMSAEEVAFHRRKGTIV